MWVIGPSQSGRRTKKRVPASRLASPVQDGGLHPGVPGWVLLAAACWRVWRISSSRSFCFFFSRSEVSRLARVCPMGLLRHKRHGSSTPIRACRCKSGEVLGRTGERGTKEQLPWVIDMEYIQICRQYVSHKQPACCASNEEHRQDRQSGSGRVDPAGARELKPSLGPVHLAQYGMVGERLPRRCGTSGWGKLPAVFDCFHSGRPCYAIRWLGLAPRFGDSDELDSRVSSCHGGGLLNKKLSARVCPRFLVCRADKLSFLESEGCVSGDCAKLRAYGSLAFPALGWIVLRKFGCLLSW